MAQSFAFGITGKVLEKLGNVAYEGICSAWGVRKEFEKLKDTLAAIRAVVLDAEQQQARTQELSLWLQRFKDACYDVEDLIDEFEIQALRRQVLERTGKKVRHFFSGSNPLAFRFRMGYKIRKANEMLNEIATSMAKFHLTEKHEPNDVIHRERETYSFVNTSSVIGRDEAKQHLINFLMNPTDEKDIPVLPIVGIGGIGKTTLAQLVFNEESVKSHFELRIWVCVTEDFDTKQLMIKTIQSATGMNCKDMNKEELHKALQDCLNGKRFFMVLDDVWNEDKKKWSELKDLLCGGAQWSRIIVTTRSRKVATITGTIPSYDLEHLSYENCLSLFLQLAFKEGEEKQYGNLVRIGEGIVHKCKGVALAVKTLGSLLCSTRVQHDWELVRDCELWKMKQEENDILPALKLSYDHLPWYLKQCFAFCSVFPKDFEFSTFRLIPLWMANGFLQSPYENEEPEDIGKRYIQELQSRSFFQQVEPESFFSNFKMHDLFHDLALSVAQNEVNSCNHYSTGNVRHLWFDLSKQDVSQLPNNLSRLQSLFLEDEGKVDSESLIAEVISRSKHLRVLDLACCNLEQLSNSTRYLKQLRVLSLAYNGNIKRLPNCICNLQSLQTLNLAGCRGIEELPEDIRYLISLRQLTVTTKQTRLQENGISCLTSLRTLAFSECENLEKLFEDIQNLTALREMIIYECKNLVSLPQGLKYLTALENLAISDCEKLDLTMEELELERKEDGSLRKLCIEGVPKLESLPQWILLGSTKTLQHLYIGELENVSMLPTWFQHLTSLRSLKIDDCPKLSFLPEEMQHLTSLQSLEIDDCPELSFLPEGMQHLTALKRLKIEGCPKLSKRCIKETSEDWPMIAHARKIIVKR
ncbi:putative disease resistance protein RGA3 [Gossypium raimondii]|uniref:putative disease resistance protein RGA3 n=1 Tax=Gossypium raimondii TaxID=29730 RepID=UPI00227B8492|nr:putative disease resistance protein RGA3 [Gossypium raimondii]